MVQSIGFALGVGSGVDTGKLIADLTAATRAPKDAQLNARDTRNTAKISALGDMTAGIDNFASSLKAVLEGGTLYTQPTTSGDGIGVKAIAGGSIGGLSAKVKVIQLAEAQTLTSSRQTSATSVIGNGTLTLTKANGTSVTLGTAGEDQTIQGLANAINKLTIGVSASVIRDSTGVRLSLKGPTGADESFTLTANGDTDAALATFTYPAGSVFSQVSTAKNAIVELDGTQYERPKNNISDLLSGVSIDLKRADPNVEIVIGSERQTTNLRQAVLDLVQAYNDLDAVIDKGTSPGGSIDIDGVPTRTGGALAGDYGVRSLQQQLATLTSTELASGGTISRLADIGISTNRDGSLKLDTARLDAVLASDPDGVEALFNPKTGSGDVGLGGALQTLRDNLRAKDGPLTATSNRLTAETKAIAVDREKVEARSALYEGQLRRQYTASEAMVASLKATQSYLEQQIKMWSSSD